jgi:hypothetical protein
VADQLRRDFERSHLPLVVVSAVAAVSGGPFTILRQAVAEARGFRGGNFVFVVHDARLWQAGGNVRFVGLPWARRSYLHRVLAEYVWFPVLARRWRPEVWLSLLDTTPPVSARRQAVYCQNPLPYWRPNLTDSRFHPFEVLRSFTYGLVYRAFARRNDHIVGQLPWFTEFIGQYMRVPKERWVVVSPRTERPQPDPRAIDGSVLAEPPHELLECVYVALPRVFKNFEEAIDLCDQPGVGLTLTISGDENRYSRHVRAHARARQSTARFRGHLSHAASLATMTNADVVLFPSKLETFGLPIQEAIDLERTLVLPVRPWTVAVAGRYERAFFYRSLDEGRAILGALSRGETPARWRPPTTSTDIPELPCFAELFRLLLR